MSKIMVLPGTAWQIPLIKRIKEYGHEVYIVNPIKNSGVFELADHHFDSDIFAIDDIEKYAREQMIDAIISDECDIAMPVVSELGRRLGLNTLSNDAASLYTDKFYMREFSKQIGIQSIEYKLCMTVSDALEFLRKLGKPVIIKPLDSNASHGVFKADNETDILEHFDESMSFSRVTKAVLAERYITGTEFTIDGIKTPHSHYTLAISEKKHFKHNINIANELLFTHQCVKYDYDKLKKTNDLFVMNSPLQYGFTHAEYKYENGVFYLIEIGARGGGNMISSIITQYMSGYDTYKYLIDCSLGNVFDTEFLIDSEHKDKAAVLKFFSTPQGGGEVIAIEGLDFLDTEPDIRAYKFNFKIGDEIIEAKNDSARIGFYVACSENLEKLKNVMKVVEDKVKIRVK